MANPAHGVGFHHVALKSKSWDASLAFYKGVLGFTEKILWAYPDGNRAGMFDTGGGNYLEIFEDPNYTPSPNGALLHLALRTNAVDDVVARVRAAGCKITVEPKDVTIKTTNGVGPVPIRIAFFEGPNGETWELFQNELT
ncbi:MAG: VOC family protein [Opitutaceae bacterium]|jgi:catechol 2,3-dioxygenase-like lactoylglutathione lyase family enzyme